jgi:hypothetical protein
MQQSKATRCCDWNLGSSELTVMTGCGICEFPKVMPTAISSSLTFARWMDSKTVSLKQPWKERRVDGFEICP